MRSLGTVAVVLLVAGCGEPSDSLVEERYDSLEDASAAKAIERGVLPSTVPQSAKAILIRIYEQKDPVPYEYVDGNFSISADGFVLFTSSLGPYSGEPAGDIHLAAYLEAMKDKGLSAGVHERADRLWSFVCNRAELRCEFQRR